MAVLPVNQPPTLNPIPNPATLLQNATLQTVSLTGISAGHRRHRADPDRHRHQQQHGLIPNPTSTTPPEARPARSSFTPVANASGTATITVTVMDNGGVTNGGIDTVSADLHRHRPAVNQSPTLTAIPNPAPIVENAGQQTVPHWHRRRPRRRRADPCPSPPEQQPGSFRSRPRSPRHTTTSNPTGTLTYTPVAKASGTALITVTVNGQRQHRQRRHQFRLPELHGDGPAVNQAPTLGPIINPANPSTATAAINAAA